MLGVVDAEHELFAPGELGERLHARSQDGQRVIGASALRQHSGQRAERDRRRTRVACTQSGAAPASPASAIAARARCLAYS